MEKTYLRSYDLYESLKIAWDKYFFGPQFGTRTQQEQYMWEMAKWAKMHELGGIKKLAVHVDFILDYIRYKHPDIAKEIEGLYSQRQSILRKEG